MVGNIWLGYVGTPFNYPLCHANNYAYHYVHSRCMENIVEISIRIREIKYLDKNYKSINIGPTVKKKLIIISMMISVLCGLMYNLVTIQAVYRKDINVVGESLYSQPWCREMVSDSRGIRPYYWQCVLERFQYIPILHRPPRILGHDGKILISIAFISLFINLPFTRLWAYRNSIVAHQPRADRG